MQSEDRGTPPGKRARPLDGLPPLPVPVTRPIGRDDELSRIPRWLVDSVRLVALTGVPGSGKTRLSLHVAQEVQRLASWPVLFLSLAAIDSPELIVGMIAVALSLGEDSGLMIDRVRRRLN